MVLVWWWGLVDVFLLIPDATRGNLENLVRQLELSFFSCYIEGQRGDFGCPICGVITQVGVELWLALWVPYVWQKTSAVGHSLRIVFTSPDTVVTREPYEDHSSEVVAHFTLSSFLPLFNKHVCFHARVTPIFSIWGNCFVLVQIQIPTSIYMRYYKSKIYNYIGDIFFYYYYKENGKFAPWNVIVLEIVK